MEYETLFASKWMDVRKAPDGYVFCHSNHGKGQGVAVLVYNPVTCMFVGRYEITPSHTDRIKLASLTGGVEDNNPIQTAQNELWEEAGIKAKLPDIISLGRVYYSKNSDTVVHLFCLEYSGKIMRNPPGDGSDGEKSSYADWITDNDILNSSDPLLITMYARFVQWRDIGFK